MPLTFDCPSCSRTIRVAEKFAGRRAKCPGCAAPLTVPQPEPQLEILPDDPGTYEIDIEPPAEPAPTRLRSLDERPAAVRERDEDEPDTRGEGWLAAKLREKQREPMAVPWYRREFISLFGLGITPLWLLLIPLALAGFGLWYATGPGKAAHLTAAPVHVVEVLDKAEIQEPTGRGAALHKLPLGGVWPDPGSSPSPAGAPLPGVTATGHEHYTLSVGGNENLVVTKPDADGDHVLIYVELKQGTLNNLGQLQKYDTVFREDAFKLRRSRDTGDGVAGRIVTADFDGQVNLTLAGAQTNSIRAMLPPESTAKPDRNDEERQPGAITGEVEYALGNVKGTVSYYTARSTTDFTAPPGITGDGELIITHPDGGPRVEADYRGHTLEVTWDAGSTGHWTRNKVVQDTHPSPWHRHRFALLFPRPADAGSYTLTLAGRDIGTVKLDRMKQPSAPAPSPIAARRPGGPAPASKSASGPLAYFDVLRDARSQAQGIVSANNMRQIGLALQSYLNDHRGRFPETLLDLRDYVPIEALMTNPRTGENPGFIYEPPPPGAPPATTPVLFEALGGMKDLTGAILYADGSIR